MEFMKIDEKEHDAFVSKHPLCNLLQSSKWGHVKDNWDTLFVGIKQKDTVIASAMILVKSLPFACTMFYIPRGPIMDYEKKEVVSAMLQGIKKIARKHHCVMVTFDPAIHCNDYIVQQKNEQRYSNIPEILALLAHEGAVFKGFTKELSETIQPRYHANVYACDDQEATMSKTLKKALATVKKKGIVIEETHEDGVEAFSKIMQLTEKRKNIHLRNQEYFLRLMRIYGDAAVIYLAKLPIKQLLEKTQERLKQNEKELEECPENAKKKRFTLEELHTSLSREACELEENHRREGDAVIIAGALCVKFGDTAELLYAGMDDRYKRYMPSYACFHQCIQWSFQKGCQWCNMGGVEGTLQGGLTNFKANFQPRINEFIGEFDFPVSFLYRPAKLAMKLRKKI